MLIDSHCHLDQLKLDHYRNDLEKAIQVARKNGVQRMLCVGINLENVNSMIALVKQYPDVYASVGVHPLEKDLAEPDMETLIRYSTHEKVVAIGESGLDYFYSAESKEVQKSRFVIHLQAAAQTKLPLIVHTRAAREDTIQLIQKYGDLETAGVLHCFTENWKMAKKAIDMNYLISISGIVTFRNSNALRDVVKKIPLDRMIIETDSPYLTPVPYRGKSNEPKYLPYIARYIAELKNISIEKLSTITSKNFFRLFSKAE